MSNEAEFMNIKFRGIENQQIAKDCGLQAYHCKCTDLDIGE